jgi:hypothetical protein
MGVTEVDEALVAVGTAVVHADLVATVAVTEVAVVEDIADNRVTKLVCK